MAPQIARALRRRPHPRSVEALVRKLADPDRETRTESARTLGAIGDRRAAPSLLEMLASASDNKVVAASSDALARLGELAAVYEILPRMQATRNPVLHRSLAVAVADLLGPHDSFYPFMIAEEQERGMMVPKWMKRLRRRVRVATRESLPEQGRAICAMIDALETAYDIFKIISSLEKFSKEIFMLSLKRSFFVSIRSRWRFLKNLKIFFLLLFLI